MYFVDHEHGGCYHTLTRDNRKHDDEKAPSKSNYHNMGACYEVLNVIHA